MGGVARLDAGVVHPYVYAAEVLERGFAELERAGLLRDVRLHEHDARGFARCVELVGEFLGLAAVLVAVEVGDDAHALLQESPRDAVAEADGCAGDYGGLAVEVGIHGVPPLKGPIRRSMEVFGAALALQRGSVALLSRHCHAPGTGRGKPAECGGWAAG